MIVGSTLKANAARDDAGELRNEIAAIGDASRGGPRVLLGAGDQRPPQCDAYAKKR